MLMLVIAGCASKPVVNTPVVSTPEVSAMSPDQLDTAVRETSDYLNANLTKGNKLVILNIQSDYPALSEYIIDELIANTVSDKLFAVVDRRQLDAIRAELHFQMSEEVDDTTAQELGRMAGAQIIISGAVSKIGDLYRLRIRALSVQSAEIEGQFNRNIPDGPTVAALVRSQATGYGDGSSAASSGSKAPAAVAAPAVAASAQPGAAQAGQAAMPAPTAPAAPATLPSPAPPPPAPKLQAPGALYVGDVLQGEMGLLDALDWIVLNARAGGKYTIALGRDEVITPTELSYGGKTLSITLKSAGGEQTVSFAGASPSYSLFNVKPGVTFTLEDGVTLEGPLNTPKTSPVEVTGGRFVMNGGTKTGNTNRKSGGGVLLASGTFTMNNGTISGNIANASEINGGGGGVYVRAGTFTMNGGTIRGNTTSCPNSYRETFGGGGVFVTLGGTFIMNEGSISGNTSSARGGGVFISHGTFTKSGKGGVIYGSDAEGDQANRSLSDNGHAVANHDRKRNTTARAATAMDSTKAGPAGGWE
jgi:hypothetical protein